MKMRCMECQATVKVSRSKSWTASRPRCFGCGSLRLEEWTPKTKKQESQSAALTIDVEPATTPEPTPEPQSAPVKEPETLSDHLLAQVRQWLKS